MIMDSVCRLFTVSVPYCKVSNDLAYDITHIPNMYIAEHSLHSGYCYFVSCQNTEKKL